MPSAARQRYCWSSPLSLNTHSSFNTHTPAAHVCFLMNYNTNVTDFITFFRFNDRWGHIKQRPLSLFSALLLRLFSAPLLRLLWTRTSQRQIDQIGCRPNRLRNTFKKVPCCKLPSFTLKRAKSRRSRPSGDKQLSRDASAARPSFWFSSVI